MEKRPFVASGPLISPLGYGAGHVGGLDLSEDFVGELLNKVVDAGINLIDTARGYGLSEERIGRHLSWRRKDFVISTKVGYGIPGAEDWSYDAVRRGVETALKLMRTDRIDIVHLHSCSLETLKKGDVIRALHRCREEGLIGLTAYSGENEELRWALASRAFDSLQLSVNIADQRCIREILPDALTSGAGIIAKRPLANAPWRFEHRPEGDYCETYWVRLKAMNLGGELSTLAESLDWGDLALRFAAFTPGVGSCIVGSIKWPHILSNIEAVKRGPLPSDLYDKIRRAFDRNDENWIGQI